MITLLTNKPRGRIRPLALGLGLLTLTLAACTPPTEEPKDVTVQFDDNGATVPVAVSSMTVEEGQTLGQLPEAPAKKIALFLGWYTDRDGGDRFSATTPVNRNLTVYAHWRVGSAESVEHLPFSVDLRASSDGQTILAFGDEFLGLSLDGGATWTELVPFSDGVAPDNGIAGAISPDGTHLFLAGSYSGDGGSVHRSWYSSDQGQTWSENLDTPYLSDFVVTNTGAVVADGLGRFTLSTDGGVTWTTSYPFNHRDSVRYLIGPDQTIVATSAGGGTVALSRDAGAHWTVYTNPYTLRGTARTTDGSTLAALGYVGDEGPLVFTSVDQGETWVRTSDTEAMGAKPREVYYLGTTVWSSDSSYLYSNTGTDTWTKHQLMAVGLISTGDKLLGWNSLYGVVTTDGTTWYWGGRATQISPE